MTAAGSPELDVQQLLRRIRTAASIEELEALAAELWRNDFRDLWRSGQPDDVHHLHYRLRLRRRQLTTDAGMQSVTAEAADVVPARWVDELRPVLVLRNPKLHLVTVRCEGQPRSHGITVVYQTSMGPVALFNAFTITTDFSDDDRAYPGSAAEQDFIDVETERILVQRTVHPAGKSALALLGESATASLGAECRCSRQQLSVEQLLKAVALAADRRDKHVPLGLLHGVPRD